MMKRTFKTITAIVMVLTLCLGVLTACSGGSPVGQWKMGKVVSEGIEVDLSDENNMFAGIFSSMTIEFKSDGTVVASGFGEVGEASKWELNGSTINVDGEKFGEFKGNEIVCEADGTTLTLIRK